MKEMAEETSRRKQADRDAVGVKVKMQKSLTEFRQTLRDRLKERKDPLQGPVRLPPVRSY